MNLNQLHQSTQGLIELGKNEASKSEKSPCPNCKEPTEKTELAQLHCFNKHSLKLCIDCFLTVKKCKECQSEYEIVRNNRIVKRQMSLERSKRKIRQILTAAVLKAQRFDSGELIQLYMSKMFEVMEQIRQEAMTVLKDEAKEIVKTRFGNESEDDKKDLDEIEKSLNELHGKGEFEETEFGKLMISLDGYLKQNAFKPENRPHVIIQSQ